MGAPVDDRERDTLLLASSLYDYLPLPKAPTLGDPGLAASRFVPCGACGARGRVLGPGVVCVRCEPRKGPSAGPPAFDTGHGCTPCLLCGGDGWRRARPSDDDWDAYAGVPIGTREAAPAKLWQREQQTARQLGRTDFLLRLWTDESLDEPWEEARKRQFASGSYENFLRAARALERVNRERLRLFWRVHVVGEPLSLTEGASASLKLGLSQLTLLMPDPIRVPRHLREADRLKKESLWRGRTPRHDAQRLERDAAIPSLVHTLGASVIAVRYGMTTRRVRQIVASAA